MLFHKYHNGLALLLTGFYFLTVMKPALPVLDYTINYGVYVNILCENKDKPELHCKGTCQLAEKLNLDNSGQKQVLPVFESLYWYVTAQNLASEEDQKKWFLTRQNFSDYRPASFPVVYPDQPTPPPIRKG